MTLNEARDRAALAWLAERVSEAIIAIGDPVRSADLEVWLSKMPKYDRHAADAPKVDDGRAPVSFPPELWFTGAEKQPMVGLQVEIPPNAALGQRHWRGFWTDTCLKVAPESLWRYI